MQHCHWQSFFTWAILTVCVLGTSAAHAQIAFNPAQAVATGGINPTSVAVVDLDADGHRDLIVTNQTSGSIALLQNKGQGTFKLVEAPSVGDAPVAVIAPYLQGQGDTLPDVIIADPGTAPKTFSGNLIIYQNMAGLSLPSATFLTSTNGIGKGPMAVIAANFTNATKLDLAVLNLFDHNVAVFVQDGTFQKKVNIPENYPFLCCEFPRAVMAGDLDNDNRADLVLAYVGRGSDDKIEVYKSNGDGTFALKRTIGLPNTSDSKCANDETCHAISMTIADFDGDNKLDIAVANEFAGIVSVFRNNGDWSFTPTNLPTIHNAPVFVTAAKLDGDSKPDLVVVNRGSNNITVLQNTTTPGNVRFTAQNFAVGAGPVFAAVDDLDGDGKLDIVVVNQAGNTVSVLLTAPVPAPTITSPSTASGTYGTAFTYTITATNAPTSYSASGLPPGLSITTSTGLVSGTPTQVGTFSVTLSATNAGGTGTGTLTLTIAKATPTLTWSVPAAIVYGTALSATQLNATASVPGTFTYTPGAGTVLNAGANQPLSVTFTPTDSANYTPATGATTLTVTKAPATVTLGSLSATYDGTAQSVTTTTAPSGLSVSVTYGGSPTPPVNAGTYAVVATVSDANYQGTATGTLIITKATPTLTWSAPAAIVYGTALSAMQLNATASVPGTFAYTPGAGTVLNAGANQALSVAFTSTDGANYTTATGATMLTISKAPLTVQADDKTKVQGAANPPLTLTYTGFVNGETASVLDTPPTLSTPATTSSPVGTYPITLASGSDDNYALTLQNGTLTVVPAMLTISPPTGLWVQTEAIDLVLICEAPSGVTVTGGSATLDGSNVTAAVVACIRGGTLTGARTGVTYRCPGLTGGIFGVGFHTFTVQLTLSDRTAVQAAVTWEVFSNHE